MDAEQSMEKLNRAFVHGIAALAGFSCVDNPADPNRRIDVSIKKDFDDADTRRAEIVLQLTSTQDPSVVRSNQVHFDLDKTNYDELRGHSTVPHFLVITLMPAEFQRIGWGGLVLGQRAWWFDLAGEKDCPEPTTFKTIVASKHELLTPAVLQQWMETAQDTAFQQSRMGIFDSEFEAAVSDLVE